MQSLTAYVRSLNPQLPQDVWILQLGGLVNAFGNGIMLPFLVIYLHNVRGIPLGIAGLVAATNSVFGFASGFVAGFLAAWSFTALFLLDAATFLAYVVVLLRITSPALHPEREGGSYRQVVRDRVFMSYTLLNALVIAASVAVWVELLPPFAKNQAHVSTQGIGLLWAVDSIVVVFAQLPVTKLADGHRRM